MGAGLRGIANDGVAGAPFSSCTAVAFSPFLTWSEASNLVGAPYSRSSQGDLPLKYTSAFINAP